jgi:hypothetical protein
MSKLIDLTGQQFGLVTIIGMAEKHSKHHRRWHCECACGKRYTILGKNVSRQRGIPKSCGCAEKNRGGKAKTREYSIWSKMKARCYDANMDNYRYYGALGTYVCERWRESFLAFLADMGVAPSSEHTLDRINTKGSYTCGKCDECVSRSCVFNCRWATKYIQHRNQRSNRYYTHDGKTLILKDWARLRNIRYLTLWQRLAAGWDFPTAIETPTRLTKKYRSNLSTDSDTRHTETG